MTTTYDLASLYFSSEFPDLTFSTPSERVYVELTADGMRGYEMDLFACDGRVVVCDLRDVIEEIMVANNLTYCYFHLELVGNEGDNYIRDFSVVFCKRRMAENPVNWLATHFLTSLHTRRTTRTSWEELFYYEEMDENTTAHYKVTLRYGDVYRTVDIDGDAAVMEDTGIAHLVVGYPFIKQFVESHALEGVVDVDPDIAESPDDIVAWTVSVGGRTASYFVDDKYNDISMVFRNNFNVLECACFAGKTTSKAKMSKSEAVVSHNTCYYDLKFEKEFQIESSPLSIDEARWLEELIFSRETYLEDRNTSNLDLYQKILITEPEVEISDDDIDMNKVSFTWRYEDNRDHVPAALPSADIFQHQFDRTFK